MKAWGQKTVNWGFPRGKINKDETELKCAIREVIEEVGFNIEGRVNENDHFEASINGHKVRMYVVPGVSESTCFSTQTRNEIGVGSFNSSSSQCSHRLAFLLLFKLLII